MKTVAVLLALTTAAVAQPQPLTGDFDPLFFDFQRRDLRPEDTALMFSFGDKVIAIIKADGTIQLGDGITPDAASMEIWKLLGQTFPGKCELVPQRN